MEISQDFETAARLTATNLVVPRGLLVVETDTGFAKLGDGATRWTALGYWQPAPAAVVTPEVVDPESVTLAEDLLAALVALGLVAES